MIWNQTHKISEVCLYCNPCINLLKKRFRNYYFFWMSKTSKLESSINSNENKDKIVEINFFFLQGWCSPLAGNQTWAVELNTLKPGHYTTREPPEINFLSILEISQRCATIQGVFLQQKWSQWEQWALWRLTYTNPISYYQLHSRLESQQPCKYGSCKNQ